MMVVLDNDEPSEKTGEELGMRDEEGRPGLLTPGVTEIL
jgi:hypothetical protein